MWGENSQKIPEFRDNETPIFGNFWEFLGIQAPGIPRNSGTAPDSPPFPRFFLGIEGKIGNFAPPWDFLGSFWEPLEFPKFLPPPKKIPRVSSCSKSFYWIGDGKSGIPGKPRNPGNLHQNPGNSHQNPGISAQNPGNLHQNPGISAQNSGILSQKFPGFQLSSIPRIPDQNSQDSSPEFPEFHPQIPGISAQDSNPQIPRISDPNSRNSSPKFPGFQPRIPAQNSWDFTSHQFAGFQIRIPRISTPNSRNSTPKFPGFHPRISTLNSQDSRSEFLEFQPRIPGIPAPNSRDLFEDLSLVEGF
ncbi:uncharacterized protein LOC131591103 [Poecile atricapillus]|uniref:uncharacterized protein LOC131591103 n=1 Tax=Poecile atricapillus TaxID=48891 RepID=UPI00273882A9|nr:uncharacterized protein LOC131591103 [Poecile atricapillus]